MIENGNIVLVDNMATILRLKKPKELNGKEIKGYPINEEILLKNGWKYKDYYYFYGNEFNGAKLVQFKDYWTLRIDNQETTFKGWVRDVHELQGAMSVCGFERRWRL